MQFEGAAAADIGMDVSFLEAVIIRVVEDGSERRILVDSPPFEERDRKWLPVSSQSRWLLELALKLTHGKGRPMSQCNPAVVLSAGLHRARAAASGLSKSRRQAERSAFPKPKRSQDKALGG